MDDVPPPASDTPPTPAAPAAVEAALPAPPPPARFAALMDRARAPAVAAEPGDDVASYLARVSRAAAPAAPPIAAPQPAPAAPPAGQAMWGAAPGPTANPFAPYARPSQAFGAPMGGMRMTPAGSVAVYGQPAQGEPAAEAAEEGEEGEESEVDEETEKEMLRRMERERAEQKALLRRIFQAVPAGTIMSPITPESARAAALAYIAGTLDPDSMQREVDVMDVLQDVEATRLRATTFNDMAPLMFETVFDLGGLILARVGAVPSYAAWQAGLDNYFLTMHIDEVKFKRDWVMQMLGAAGLQAASATSMMSRVLTLLTSLLPMVHMVQYARSQPQEPSGTSLFDAPPQPTPPEGRPPPASAPLGATAVVQEPSLDTTTESTPPAADAPGATAAASSAPAVRLPMPVRPFLPPTEPVAEVSAPIVVAPPTAATNFSVPDAVAPRPLTGGGGLSL